LAYYKAISVLYFGLAGAVPEHLIDGRRCAGRFPASEEDLKTVARPLRIGTGHVWRTEQDTSLGFYFVKEKALPRRRPSTLCGVFTRRCGVLRGSGWRCWQQLGRNEKQIRIQRMNAHGVGARQTKLIFAIQIGASKGLLQRAVFADPEKGLQVSD